MKLSLPKFLLAAPLCLTLCSGNALAQAAAPDEATLAKRAKAYGALAHLPGSTEGALVIRDLNGVFDAIVESNVFARIMELSGEGGDASKQIVAQIRQGLATYAGEEVILAYSEGSAAQVKHLMALYDAYVRISYGAIGRGLGSGNFDGDLDPQEITAEVKKSLADKNSALSKAIDNIQIPPILIGSKMPDAAEALVAQMDQLEGELPPFVQVANFQVEDAEFKSWSISLQEVFDENMEAEMRDGIGDKELSDRLAKAIRSKRVELSFGAINGYLVIGIGRDHEHLKFVENPAESIIAHPKFAKLDAYLDKPLHGIAFAKKKLLESDTSDKMLKTMTDSFVDGLTNDAPGLMKKIGRKVKKLGNQMMKLSERKATDYVGVMYGGNGLHGDGYGGWMPASIDGKKKLAFANANLDNAFLVIDNATKPEYNRIGMEMMENLASMVPLGVQAYAEMSGDEGPLEQFTEFSNVFGPKLDKIWNIMSKKVSPGLGENAALIVDLNGTLPKIPMLPRALVNEGKAPRIAAANTVKDRKLLSEAWEELVPAVNDILAEIPGQRKGSEVQMPDTLTSEKGGLATHYVPMPFMSNDFMPSLSISDKLFFLSTSKKFSEEIAAKANKGDGDIRGVYARANFSALNKFATDWLDLVRENKDAVFAGNEFAAEDFEEGSEIAKQVLKLVGALKSFEYNKYTTDGDDARSSWHLHLEDVK